VGPAFYQYSRTRRVKAMSYTTVMRVHAWDKATNDEYCSGGREA